MTDCSDLIIYTAGPLFSDDDIATCEVVEAMLRDMGIKFHAPRLLTAEEGKELGAANRVLAEARKDFSQVPREEIDAAVESRRKNAKIILDQNLKAIHDCNLMIANIDNRDPGTMFEIGYAVASGIPVITYSAHNYGVNLMIGETAICHATSWVDLESYIKKIVPYVQLQYKPEKIRNLAVFTKIREKDERPME